MRSALNLIVDEGTVSRKKSFPIEGEWSLGGNGSGADLQLPDLPDGQSYLKFIHDGEDGWGVQEHTSGVARINGSALRYSNPIKNGTLLQLTRRDGSGDVVLRAKLSKTRSGAATTGGFFGKLKPLDIGMVAVGIFIVIGLLAMNILKPTDAPARMLTTEAMIKEVSRSAKLAPSTEQNALLSATPTTLMEVRRHLVGLDAPEQERLIDAFTGDLAFRIAEGKRLERLGLTGEARASYTAVVEMLEDNDLQATKYALRALNRLN